MQSRRDDFALSIWIRLETEAFQVLSSVAKMFVKVFNWLVTVFYFYVSYRGVMLLFFETDVNKYKSIVYQYGMENRNKYLSVWVSFLQVLYFLIVSTADIIDSCPSIFKCPRWSRECHTIRHYMLTSLVLPLTLYIFVVFWTFFLYDRESIYPELFDRFIPPWLNYAMHAYPVPILIVHLVICPNHNPSQKSAILGLTLLFVVYGSVLAQAIMKGNWVYLLFNDMKPSHRIFLLSISYPLVILFLIFSRWLNSFVKDFKELHSSRRIKNN